MLLRRLTLDRAVFVCVSIADGIWNPVSTIKVTCLDDNRLTERGVLVAVKFDANLSITNEETDIEHVFDRLAERLGVDNETKKVNTACIP